MVSDVTLSYIYGSFSLISFVSNGELMSGKWPAAKGGLGSAGQLRRAMGNAGQYINSRTARVL